MLLGVTSGISVAETENLDARRGELEGVRSRIEVLQKALSEAAAEKDAATQELRIAEQRIGHIARRIHELEGEQTDNRARLGELAADRERQLASIQNHQIVLAREVAASFVMGRQERLKLMLNQQSPERVSRVLSYYEYLHRRRAERIEAAREAVRKLNQTEKAIAEEESEIQRLLTEETQAREELLRTQDERNMALAVLKADIEQGGLELQQLHDDEVRLKGLVARLVKLQEELAATWDIQKELGEVSGPFHERKGRMHWPTEGRLRASFGSSKSNDLTWDGALISAKAGDVVRAIHGGQVVYSDWLKGYGLMLIIDHGEGYMSLYGYNQSLYKSAGEWVAAGDVVATVGQSGGRADAGLYFAIRYEGEPVDPARWCRKSKKRAGGKA